MTDKDTASNRRLLLAYAESSSDLIAPLIRALAAAGFDVQSAPANQTLADEAIDKAGAVIVCWTPAAVASDTVNLQAARARKVRKLAPVLLAPCTPPANLGGAFGISDLSGWRGDPSDKEFLGLVQSIHARLSGRVLSGEFWKSRYFTWGGTGAVALAAIAIVANFGDLKQAIDGVFNTAASEKALGVTDAKVDEVLQLLKGKADRPLDANAETVLRESVERLLSSQDGARHSAGRKLAGGDVDGAITELQSAADEGEKAVARLVVTWKDIGALAFPERTLEAVKAYERVTQLAPEDLDSHLQLAELYVRLGHFDRAKEAYLFVLENPAAGQEWEHAVALGGLGFISMKMGEAGKAETYLKEALAFHQESGDIDGQAAAYLELGQLRQSNGDRREAEQLFKRSLDLFRKSANLLGQGLAHLRTGNVELRRGDPDAAEKSFNHTLAIARQLEDSELEADGIGSLGDVARAKGDAAAARRLYLEALDLAHRISAQEIEAYILTALGELATETGDEPEAIRRLQEARGLYKMMGLTSDAEDVERQLKALGATPHREGPEN